MPIMMRHANMAALLAGDERVRKAPLQITGAVLEARKSSRLRKKVDLPSFSNAFSVALLSRGTNLLIWRSEIHEPKNARSGLRGFERCFVAAVNCRAIRIRSGPSRSGRLPTAFSAMRKRLTIGCTDRTRLCQAPADLLMDELGAAVVREILEQIDHGMFA
jgi:hypothetical protein